MHVAVVTLGAALALVAAGRGVWSPCGLSMLSTITPVGERGRGNRYRTTAAWFIAGAASGGASLGAALALLAALADVAGPGPAAVGSVVAAAALAAMASDTRLRGFTLPAHRRQVNERWLDRYRPWVYGGGFGWQIGTGFCTYVVTAANYLLVVVAGLTGSPLVAAALGVLYGTARGLAVLLAARVTSFEALQARHTALQSSGPAVRDLTVAVEAVTAAVAAAVAWPPAALVVGALAVVVVLAAGEWRRAPACSLDAQRG